MKYIFDTNAIIYYLQGNAALREVAQCLDQENAEGIVSVIIQIELLSNKKFIYQEDRIKELLSIFFVQRLSSEIVNHTIEIKKNYNLKIPDAIIAATAMHYNTSLVTADSSFERIENLKIINPFK